MTAGTARTTRALVLALAVVGLVACRGPEGVAATVDGEPIAVAEVDRELADIASNQPFLEARRQQGLAFRGVAPGSYDAAVVAELVDRKVTALLVRRELDRRGLEPSPADLVRARDELRSQLVDPASGASLLDGFPNRYVDEQARLQAESDILQASEGGVALDDAALRGAYEAEVDRYREWCVRWIVSGPTDPEAADRAAAAVAAGEDFAQVAQRESADPQSAGRGGALGCRTLDGLARLGDRFTSAVTALGPGQLSPPTRAEFGTFVVQVTDVKVRPFDEVRGSVRARVLERAEDAYEALLRRLRSDARVTVAARYGTWERSGDGRAGIRPPGPRSTGSSAGPTSTQPLTGLPGAPGQTSP